MRQAGVIAAAALYALENNILRLSDDHANAGRLANLVREIDALSLTPPEIDSNIVIFHVEPELGTAEQFAARLKQHGLLTLAIGHQSVRMVTHLDVDRDDVEAAGEVLRTVASGAATI
jgi:threonine aldolase